MKIGIITQPLHTNYGGILQNFALQVVLKQLGHTPITLRESFDADALIASPITYHLRWAKSMIMWLVKSILGINGVKPVRRSVALKSINIMDDFIKKNIECTRAKELLEPKDVINNNIQAIVVGSDQVWRPKFEKHIMRHQFLGFAKDLNIKKISYAASFGTDEWEYTDVETEESNRLIKNFDSISVREYQGVDMCKKYWGIDAEWVLDPVMLLDKDFYSNLCRTIQNKNNEKFVFAYILTKGKEKIRMAYDIANKLKCKVIFLSADATNNKQSVQQWIANFRDAQWIVTDSFHGAVFSLLFEKQFLCFINHETGNARMDTLKRISGLDDRFIEHYVAMPSSIDYSMVKASMDKMRQSSLNFLSKSLVD